MTKETLPMSKTRTRWVDPERGRMWPRTREVVRSAGTKLEAIARAWGVDASQVSRELNGIRPGDFGRTEQKLYAMAESGQADPFRILAHWIAECGMRERLAPGETVFERFRAVSYSEQLAQGAADVATYMVMDGATIDELEALESSLLEHASLALSMLSLTRRLRLEMEVEASR